MAIYRTSVARRAAFPATADFDPDFAAADAIATYTADGIGDVNVATNGRCR